MRLLEVIFEGRKFMNTWFKNLPVSSDGVIARRTAEHSPYNITMANMLRVWRLAWIAYMAWINTPRQRVDMPTLVAVGSCVAVAATDKARLLRMPSKNSNMIYRHALIRETRVPLETATKQHAAPSCLLQSDSQRSQLNLLSRELLQLHSKRLGG